jgi:hypothetical protein
MPSFITPSQKNAFDQALNNMHDTFARDIYVYVEEVQSMPINLNYNALYGRVKNQSNSQLNKVLTKYQYKARIYYPSSQNQSISDFNAQTNLIASEGRVRIKVKLEAVEKIKICSKIEIDDNLYVLDSDFKIEDQISQNFYTLYLKREN